MAQGTECGAVTEEQERDVKSAKERAAEAVRLADSYEGNSLTNDELAERLAASFREHARDQRHLCAEAAQSIADGGEDVADFYADRAHSAVINARAPGMPLRAHMERRQRWRIGTSSTTARIGSTARAGGADRSPTASPAPTAALN
jgi:hypothetical protein